MKKIEEITYLGKTQSIVKWAEELNINVTTLRSRIKRGATVEQALTNKVKEKYRDISDEKFGKLLVIKRVGSSNTNKALWECRCDCGNMTKVVINHLLSNSTKSCGCLRLKGNFKHGRRSNKTKCRTYNIWAGMLSRCNNYVRNYGAKGITVCERWHEFENFIIDMGMAPDNMSIDRIDSKGNYELSNCKWSTSTEQNRNTSRNRYLTYNNETKCLAEWAQITNISENVIRWRLKQKWTVEDALTISPKINTINISFNGKTQSMWGWAKELNINYDTLRERINTGWSVEKALTTPVKTN